jgi:hypothetical protein
MPTTEHDPRSFKLDNTTFSQQMIIFSVTGVFKEGKASDRVRPLRSFQRIFVCIPDINTKMSIVNEQYIIGNVTSEQFDVSY